MNNDPPYLDAKRCIEIRKRSKSGKHITSEEIRFCEMISNTYTEWYDDVEEDIYNATVPFGSSARYR